MDTSGVAFLVKLDCFGVGMDIVGDGEGGADGKCWMVGTLLYFVAQPGRPQEAAEAEKWTEGVETAPRMAGSKTQGSARMTSLEEGPG